MPQKQIENAIPSVTQQAEVAEAEAVQTTQPEPLLHVATGAGGVPNPQAQATALNQATGGQLSRAGGSLLQIQRVYGNRYMQRVVDQARPAPNRTGLPDNLKSGIENLSGMAMDDVRVHYNSAKPATVQALAYTQGSDIHVGPGQEMHLPHEAWHVVQQKQGRVKPTMQTMGISINDDETLEKDADTMGVKALHMSKQEGNEELLPEEAMKQMHSEQSAGKQKISEGVQTIQRVEFLTEKAQNELGARQKQWYAQRVEKFNESATLEEMESAVEELQKLYIRFCKNFSQSNDNAAKQLRNHLTSTCCERQGVGKGAK